VRRLLALFFLVLAAVGARATVAIAEPTRSTTVYSYDAIAQSTPAHRADGPTPIPSARPWDTTASQHEGTVSTPIPSVVAAEASTGAESAANGARLNEQLRLTEEYGAGGVRELPDGRMRFYGEETPARTPGEMSDGRLVREWDPARDIQRTWYETLDHEGNIRIVRPETGGPKVHYMFGPDGTYQGSW